eukprot:GHVQ01010798.1.p1 GENE.GHVQ01010798.1~~GHVQ01010798.1.p1  ORF type:complete len:530 (-),score=76.90 GHVQ01010798.1:491-2080(-)
MKVALTACCLVAGGMHISAVALGQQEIDFSNTQLRPAFDSNLFDSSHPSTIPPSTSRYLLPFSSYNKHKSISALHSTTKHRHLSASSSSSSSSFPDAHSNIHFPAVADYSMISSRALSRDVKYNEPPSTWMSYAFFPGFMSDMSAFVRGGTHVQRGTLFGTSTPRSSTEMESSMAASMAATSVGRKRLTFFSFGGFLVQVTAVALAYWGALKTAEKVAYPALDKLTKAYRARGQGGTAEDANPASAETSGPLFNVHPFVPIHAFPVLLGLYCFYAFMPTFEETVSTKRALLDAIINAIVAFVIMLYGLVSADILTRLTISARTAEFTSKGNVALIHEALASDANCLACAAVAGDQHSDTLAGTAVAEGQHADTLAGTAVAEGQHADTLAGTAVAGGQDSDGLTGTGDARGQHSDSVFLTADTGVQDSDSVFFTADTGVQDSDSVDFTADTEGQHSDTLAGTADTKGQHSRTVTFRCDVGGNDPSIVASTYSEDSDTDRVCLGAEGGEMYDRISLPSLSSLSLSSSCSSD